MQDLPPPNFENTGCDSILARPERVEGTGYHRTDDESAAGLLDYWRLLLRHRGALLLSACVGSLAGLVATLPQTPLYQAHVSLEIQGLNENFLNMKDFSPTSSGSGFYPEFDIQTQVKILESRSLLERVMEHLAAGKQTALVRDSDRLTAWRNALHLPAGRTLSREDAIASAAGHLHVKSSTSNRIVDVFCDSTDPKLAADFANTLANEFIEQNLEARWKATERTGEWLTRQLQGLKVKLERSEDDLQTYAKASHLLFTGEKDKENVADDKLRQLQAELTRAEADRASKQSRYELVGSVAVESLPEVLDDPNLREYQIKLTDLRRQLAEFSASLTPAHYKVQRVQAQINALESDLKKNRLNILSRIHNEFDTAARREKLLAVEYAEQTGVVSHQAEKAIHYNILKREVETNRQLYESMLQRVKEAGVAAAMRASAIRIVDPAVPPAAPYRPNIPRNTGTGSLAGLFIGAAILIMREKADRTLQQPGDASGYLHLPELGVIPSAKLDRSVRERGRLWSEHSPDKLDSISAPGGYAECLELVTWNHKPSLMADSFRTTLTSILFSGGNSSRVFVLTSANPGDGKTTVVTNLAIALAEIRRRVLLVDADMRRPRIHELFGLRNESGLSDFLRQQGARGCPLDKLIQDTEVPGLYALPSGRVEANTSNLLHSPRLVELLESVREVFDAVLIDTPPMLHLPDARVLGRLSDAVILVLRAGETTRDAALAARQKLREDGTPVLGTVLNGWNPAINGYGYDYTYYEKYYSRHSGKVASRT